MKRCLTGSRFRTFFSTVEVKYDLYAWTGKYEQHYITKYNLLQVICLNSNLPPGPHGLCLLACAKLKASRQTEAKTAVIWLSSTLIDFFLWEFSFYSRMMPCCSAVTGATTDNVLQHFSQKREQKLAGLQWKHWKEIPQHVPMAHRALYCLWWINVFLLFVLPLLHQLLFHLFYQQKRFGYLGKKNVQTLLYISMY